MHVWPIHRDSTLCVFGIGELLFSLWSDVPQLEHMQTLDRAVNQHLRAIGDKKQVFVNVMISGRPNFSEEVRRESAKFPQRYSKYRAAVAHVVLLTGLAGVAVRAFTSTTLLVGRPSVPTKVFDNVEDAMAWLLPYLPSGYTKERLLAAYAEGRGE